MPSARKLGSHGSEVDFALSHNFMVEVDDGIEAPRQEERGRLVSPWTPRYPLQVRIARGDVVAEMESLVWREGSCAGCHALAGPAADREPRVFLEELP